NNLQELIAYVKEHKDEVTYANAGVGAASHLCGMLFMQAIGTPLTTVPYKGTGPAMTDLLGGQVDFMCDQSTNTTGQIKAGEVKAYGVFADERLGSLPGGPALAHLARPLRAGRHAGAHHRQAVRSPEGRACRPEGDRPLRRARHGA